MLGIGLAGRQTLQQQAGPQHRVDDRVVAVAARQADHLICDAGNHGHEQDPRQDQQPEVRTADEGEHDDRDHHHPQQERGAAAQMDARVPRSRLRSARVASLECVDGHVLCGMELEHAAQVGQQRQKQQVGDEQADADHALDDDEQDGVVNRQEVRHDAGDNLEDHDAEDHCHHQRDDDLLATELLRRLTVAALLTLVPVIARRQARRQRQRLHADRERLAERHDATYDGPTQDGRAQRDRALIFHDRRNAAIRTSNRDGPRRRSPHHHALDNGLPTDGLAHRLPPNLTRTRPWRGAC